MKRRDFRGSTTGRLVRVQGDVWAFVPNPLPPTIAYDAPLVELMAEAEAELGTLRGIGERLANPHLLIVPYTRREAVLSSKIEGTQTTLSELFRAEIEPAAPREGDVVEVRNYVGAMNEALESLGKVPLSLRTVRQIHRTLLTGVRGHERAPGEFRRDQNYIGAPGSKLEDATYVPPPVPDMRAALSDWEKFIHVRSGFPVLIQCAMLHYQFEAIHPFSDGNGRVGRLFITLFLCERGRMRQPLLYLSAFFEKHRKSYYEHLLAISRDGDWSGWLTFFLRGVAEQSRAAVNHAERILSLNASYRERLQVLRMSGPTLATLDLLFENPYVTVPRVAEATRTTYPTAQKIIDRLIRAKIIVQLFPEQKWRRIYCAKELLRTLEQ